MIATEEPGRAEDGPVTPPDQERPEMADRELLLQFESLGGTGHGSEFGQLQSDFGADRVGLLRWADLGEDLLIRALESRFEGVGARENTLVFAPGGGEWWTRDTRYWMAMRSFVKASDATEEQMKTIARRRLTFLRRKLIGDLAAGDKIFVYRNMLRNPAPENLDRLHRAVRAYGDSSLLCVQYADETHAPGRVELAAPGLLIGYMKHFRVAPDGKLIGPVNDAWLDICRQAHQIVWPAGIARPAAPPATQPEAPATRPRPATAYRQRSGPRNRRIVLIGNCQMQAMAGLYRRFVAGRTGDVLHHVLSYQDLTDEGRDAIAQADLVVEQLFDMKPRAETEDVTSSAPRLYIPMVTAGFLWPFAGQPHPKNQGYPFLTGGPYGGEASDSYLNRQILAGMQPEEAVEAYMNLDVRSRVNLDRLFELIIDRQRVRDEAAGYSIADAIERYFRNEQIFLSPYHPNTRISVLMATQFFEQLHAEPDEIARMQHCTRITPFPKSELPLHPGVCRHFGLDFVTPDRRYRFMNEGLFTFREYALRYMRYEWNAALEEGLDLIHKSSPAQARARLEEGLRLSPLSAAGHSGMRHILILAGEHQAALAAARRAVEIEPDHAAFRANLAMVLRDVGQLEEAEAELRAAVQIDPTDPHPLTLLAHLLRQRGRLAEGLNQLRTATEYDPYSSKLFAEIAGFCSAMGDAAGAEEAVRAMLELEPDSADSYIRLAHLRAQSKQMDEAVAAVSQAVQLEPRNARHRNLLSDFLMRQGRPDEALTEALRAVLCEPDRWPAYVQLGHVLRSIGEPMAAEEAFRKAIELEPGEAHCHHELSVLMKQQDRLGEAVKEAWLAVQLQPGNPHRLDHLAAYLIDRNDLATANDLMRRTAEIVPHDVSIQLAASEILARANRLADAIAEAQSALERQPDSTRANVHMAHLCQMAGDCDAAERYLLRAQALDPRSNQVRHRLTQIRALRTQVAAA